jgi:hypothetical protein
MSSTSTSVSAARQQRTASCCQQHTAKLPDLMHAPETHPGSQRGTACLALVAVAVCGSGAAAGGITLIHPQTRIDCVRTFEPRVLGCPYVAVNTLCMHDLL